MKKSWFAALIMTLPVLAQDRIDDFQWRKRLLVFSECDAAMWKQIVSEQPGLQERDIQVLVVSGAGADSHGPSEKLAEDLRRRLGWGDATVYLIGKDGRTTLRWPLGDFRFPTLYARVDAMPMRQREMRQKE